MSGPVIGSVVWAHVHGSTTQVRVLGYWSGRAKVGSVTGAPWSAWVSLAHLNVTPDEQSDMFAS